MAARAAEARCYVPEEERQPAQYERAHYDAERSRGFVLPLHLYQILVLRRCVKMIGAYLVEGQGLRRAAAVQLTVVIVHVPARPVRQEHRVPHPAVHLFLLPVRLLKYRQIGKGHYRAWYPERYARREYRVALVDLELAQVRMKMSKLVVVARRVPAVEYRHERYYSR